MTEWKPVPGFEDSYSVSDDGRIVRTSTHGKHPKPIWRELKLDRRNGYPYIDLRKDNERSRFYVHRLVVEAFRGPIPSRAEPNHENGIRHDNRLSNLITITRSENMLHCFKQLSPSLNRTRGSIHHKSKLSEDNIRTILEMAKVGLSQRTIARKFGVTKTAIASIVNGKSWKHFTSL